MSQDIEPFNYNGLDFTGYSEYWLIKDTIDYTLFVKHPFIPFKILDFAEVPFTREDIEADPDTPLRTIVPENIKEEVFINVLDQLSEAYALIHGANTNEYVSRVDPASYYSEEKVYTRFNEFWPVITKESVAEYYSRNGITPYLDFDGNPERK